MSFCIRRVFNRKRYFIYKEMNTAVLFLVFNRPNITRRVFQRIRQAKPTRLYVAADGPRTEAERDRCEEVRNIATNVDWECEVKTLFRDKNLGCKMAVSGGIDWFFENEEMGIILEDDCLPNESFFRFCEILLNRYKDDDRIMHINGNNFGADKSNFSESDYSYHFGSMPQVWGWASWRRALKNSSWDIRKLDEFKKINSLRRTFSNEYHLQKQLKRWELVESGKIDTWDFQWHFSVISNNGLTVVPKNNLISNIGFGQDATHTKSVDSLKQKIKTESIYFPITHPKFIVPDQKIDKWYQEKMIGPSSIQSRIKIKIGQIINKIGS